MSILDLNQPNFKYFEEISQIPRASFHEEKIADYLVAFAKEHNLWYNRDEINNVIIKKPASPDKVNSEPIILQAHTDMVCVKDVGSNHDFSKDPLELFIENGLLGAKNTTLGADDGAGVANILAILSDDSIQHPPLECVFTVQEEDGVGGAKGLNYSLLTAKRMIGLDGTGEGETIFCASGVIGLKFKKIIKWEENNVDNIFYKINISGLRSGHGAVNIGDERANAIKLMARILYHIKEEFNIKLVDINGGSLANVIARDSEAIIAVNKEDASSIKEIIEEIYNEIKVEYIETDENIKIEISDVNVDSINKVITEECTDEIISLCYVMPHGLFSRNPEKPEEYRVSCNFSILNIINNEITFTNVCRTCQPGNVKELAERVKAIAKPYDTSYDVFYDYAGHLVDKNTPLTKLYEKVYKEKTGKELARIHIHCGLDIGTIYNGMKGLDIIVLMPAVYNVHTINERLDLASFKRSLEYIKGILALA
ncbi:MAG: aminoacyl-histidine dipeptidase [Clostridiales bacterium]|nr:aminoacyl-histidine dipeptidase [Clostridiales bacterium]